MEVDAMKKHTKSWKAVMGSVALVLLLVMPGTVLALIPAAPPEPAYLEDGDVMVVDGSVADWNMDVTDFFADMHRAGDATKKVEAKAYLRYDCAQGIMYVLVYTAGDWPVLAERDNSWVAINTVGNKVVDDSTASFAWVDQAYDGDDTHVKGWEASFSIPQGTYKIFVHTNVYDDGMSQTSRTTPRNEGVDLTLDCTPPTAVTLAVFNATAEGDSIRLSWETGSELDNLGFNIYRAASQSGPRFKLNGSLIASQAPGGVLGGSYEYVDSSVAPGTTYYYWLEAVGIDNSTTEYGPVSAEASLSFRKLRLTRIRLAPTASGHFVGR
jgi:hypothetical protein